MDQEKMNIQWYPGHMTKTRRQIEADLKQVDAVCEIVDARIPMSSRNPDIDAICGSKPRIIVLNRMDLADPSATKQWAAYFRSKGMAGIATDCKSRKGIADFTPAARLACKEKLERDAAKGMNRPLRVMVVGIPNVGKSTLINQISGRKGAKAENRPGVTRGKQWVTVDAGLQLMDTAGILWPKFEDPQVGMMLAYTGAEGRSHRCGGAGLVPHGTAAQILSPDPCRPLQGGGTGGNPWLGTDGNGRTEAGISGFRR